MFSPSSTSLFLDLILVRLVVGLKVADLTHAVRINWFVGMRASCGFLKLVSSMITSVTHIPGDFVFVVMRTFYLMAFVLWVSFVHLLVANFDDAVAKSRIRV